MKTYAKSLMLKKKHRFSLLVFCSAFPAWLLKDWKPQTVLRDNCRCESTTVNKCRSWKSIFLPQCLHISRGDWQVCQTEEGRSILSVDSQGEVPLEGKARENPLSILLPPPSSVPVECGALFIFAPCTPRISELQAPLHRQAYTSISSPRILGCWSYTQSPISHLVLRLLCLEYYHHPRVHIRGSPQQDFLSFIIEQPILSSIYLPINQSINHLFTHLYPIGSISLKNSLI